MNINIQVETKKPKKICGECILKTKPHTRHNTNNQQEQIKQSVLEFHVLEAVKNGQLKRSDEFVNALLHFVSVIQILHYHVIEKKKNILCMAS